jgi:anti-sigma B factor antagonist
VPDPSLIAPAGELDIATVDALRQRLIAAVVRPGDTVLDLSDVTFIDSTGLGAVIVADRLARERGGRLAVIAPRGTAASTLFTLTGVRRRLTVFESRAAAADAEVDRPRDAA